MANKKFSWAMLAGLLALGMALAGCENGVQEISGNVGINENKAPQAGTVTVTKTTDNQHYIVSWDAVAEDVNYTLYFQQVGKKTSIEVGTPQMLYLYSSSNGSAFANNDVDKWSCKIDSLPALTPGQYRFGVRTSYASGGSAAVSSDVKWAAPITVTAAPHVASVDAVKTTDGYYAIVSWDAVAGVSYYQVYVEYDEGSPYAVGYGQNDIIYSVDGSINTNTNPSKWSYRYYLYNYGTYRFKVQAVVDDDISVLPAAEEVFSSSITNYY